MLKIEVIKFEAQDVITASGVVETPKVPAANITDKKHIAACAFKDQPHYSDSCDCWCHE